MKLRPYQESCIGKILWKIKEGVRKQVIVLATGLGKTVIFSHLPEYVKKSGKKTLVLAHREELLSQAKNKIEAISPGLKVEIEQGENAAEPDADVIVASVATIGRTGSNRIKKFDPSHFGLIVIDEAHHCTASTYQNVLDYFGANKSGIDKPGHPVLLGVTATPSRSDNVGLDKVFDELTFKYDIRDGIANGYLSNIKAYTIYTNENIENVKTSMGDFNVGELAEAVNTEARNKLVVSSYAKICDGETALVFAVDVEHSENLAKLFRESGYTAASVSGETPKEDRRKILKDFEEGRIQVVVNCMVLTEGYDNPNIRAVLFARPTKSSSLYIQMGGRGTRLSEGKEYVKFLDFVDNLSKHSIISSSSLIGLSKPIKADGHMIMDLQDKFSELLSNSPAEDVSLIDLDDIDSRIQEVDIFKMAQLPEFVVNTSKYAWTPFLDGFKISLGKSENGDTIGAVIKENMLGQYDIEFFKLEPTKPGFRNGYSKNKKVALHTFSEKSKSKAMQEADRYIFEHFRNRVSLIQQNAEWRTAKPSDKQIALLRKFGYQNADQLSKGEACNLLSKHFADKSAKKKK